jgi:cation transporter-like permease
METSIKARLTFAVTLMISATLCLVVIGMVTGLLIGLFDEKVDNNKIFEMISPAFETGSSVSAAWATYRQALRDVPAQAGFPWTITYPDKP